MPRPHRRNSAPKSPDDHELLAFLDFWRDLPPEERCIRLHRARLLRLAMRQGLNEHDAEDVLQAVFLKLARRHEAPRDVEAWLNKVATNQAIDLSRAKKSEAARLRALAEAGRARAAHEGGDAAPGESLRAALDALPDEHRTILWDRHEGYKPREIARRHGIALSTAYKRLHRAGMALREALRDRRAWA